MRLVDTQTRGDGVAFLTYKLVRKNASGRQATRKA